MYFPSIIAVHQCIITLYILYNVLYVSTCLTNQELFHFLSLLCSLMLSHFVLWISSSYNNSVYIMTQNICIFFFSTTLLLLFEHRNTSIQTNPLSITPITFLNHIHKLIHDCALIVIKTPTKLPASQMCEQDKTKKGREELN